MKPMEPFLLRVDAFDQNGDLVVSVHPSSIPALLTFAKGRVQFSGSSAHVGGFHFAFEGQVCFHEDAGVPGLP